MDGCHILFCDIFTDGHVLCYVIFLIKNNLQREDIQKEMSALQTVGTDSQKEQETEVINYRKKLMILPVYLKIMNLLQMCLLLCRRKLCQMSGLTNLV